MVTYDKEKVVHTFENEIFPVLIEKVKKPISKMHNKSFVEIEEIRLRANQPIMIYKNKSGYFIDDDGILRQDKGIFITREDIEKIFLMMCDYSIYSMEEDIKQGFITIKGGHRVGLAGRVVYDGDKIKTLKNISFMNIRIAKEVKGCAFNIVKNIFADGINHTLIVSPPGCGKTTILRDMIRLISNGINEIGILGRKVALVDERSEIASCYLGVPQRDVGVRTDVLDSCYKADGIMMLLRAMSPQIIAVDEIGSIRDAEAIMDAINAGVKIIATAHGRDLDEIMKRQGIKILLENNCFKTIIFLSNKNGPGTVENIIKIN